MWNSEDDVRGICIKGVGKRSGGGEKCLLCWSVDTEPQLCGGSDSIFISKL